MADILLVDDEPATRKMVRFVLEQLSGHAVHEAETPAAAEERIRSERFDLVLMDVMMPGLNGFDLCKRVRATSNVPIMFVSASGDTPSRVRGLQLGADDYLPKPFDPTELVARVDALLRRGSRAARTDADGRLHVGDLTLDLGEHRLDVRQSRGGTRQIKLTPTEFKLLLVLARAPGRAFTREELATALWGPGGADADSSYVSLNTYVHVLRTRLEEDPRNPRHLITVRNVGYKLQP